MIGFQPELFGDDPLPEEEADTRNLSKNELYDMVAARWLLPPFNSRGVTREYLLNVHNDHFFRVSPTEMKRFEFDLSKAQQKKVGITNNALLVKKLNLLLEMHGKKWLGFTHHDVPEQNWLYRIARYVDQTNLLEFFQAHVHPEPPIHDRSIEVSRMYYGRLYASQYLFRNSNLKNHKKLWDALRMISETYRQLSSFTINQELLEKELLDTKEKVIALTNTLQDQVNKAAFTYTVLENPAIKPELIITGGEGFTPDMRSQLNTNVKLIHYVYCCDTVMDRCNSQVMEITTASLVRMGAEPRVQSAKPSPRKVDYANENTSSSTQRGTGLKSGKETPRKMDDEKV